MYFNARYYHPALNRWIQADSIVPGPGNPQALNRYTFVLGNPLKYTDPSGHWQCSGTDTCQDWIQALLDQLKSAGDVGYGAWLFFMTYDGAMKEIFGGEGVHIYLDWGGGDSAWTPGLGATVGWTLASLGHLPVEPSIHINQGIWSRPPDAGSVAVFGHEVTHLFQGLVPSLSTQGEVVGYEVQYLLLEAMGEAPENGFIAELHSLWTANDGDLANYGDGDIQDARDILAQTGNLLYATEPGRPVLQGYYRMIYGDSALNVSLNPIPIFQNLGATLRSQTSPTSSGSGVRRR